MKISSDRGDADDVCGSAGHRGPDGGGSAGRDIRPQSTRFWDWEPPSPEL
ncbi:MAG: hypothetical protein ACREP9_14360 [Candidatus Dormibacteraceae bacterium]